MNYTLSQVTGIIALTATSSLVAQTTYYAQDVNANPNSGSAWNTAADGTGTPGLSTTYSSGANDLVIGAGVNQRINTGDPVATWNAQSYTMEAGSFLSFVDNAKTATFSGGDISLSGDADIRVSFGSGVEGVVEYIVDGTSDVIMNGNSLGLYGNRAGIFKFDLNVVGSGNLHSAHGNFDSTVWLSGLTSDFTGDLLYNTHNGALRLAEGVELTGELVLGRFTGTAYDKQSTLDLGGVGDVYGIGELTMDTIVVPDGIYSATELNDFLAVAVPDGATSAQGDGTIYVGVAIPEPSLAAGLVGLSALCLVVGRRRGK